MERKILIIVGLVLAAGTLSGCTKKLAEEVVAPTPTVKVLETVEMASWKDEAGIVFNYDKKLKVGVAADDESYTDLTIKSEEEAGQIQIKAVDNKFKNLEEWAKSEVKNGQTVETTLGGVEGLKVVDPETKTLAIGVIDDDILFTVKVAGYTDYWQKKINEIVDSFEFFYPTPAANKTTQKETKPAAEENLLEEVEGE